METRRREAEGHHAAAVLGKGKDELHATPTYTVSDTNTAPTYRHHFREENSDVAGLAWATLTVRQPS